MDFISTYLDYTEGTSAPEIYRLWAAIGAVAGALERRVWVSTARSVMYPNMFIVLVGSPGVGKTQAITPVEDLWRSLKDLKVCPNNVTKAALIDALAKAQRTVMSPQSGLYEYHTLLAPISELGVMLPAHDLEFLSVLNYIYDNPSQYSEERRTDNFSVSIPSPQLNVLAGTQPGFLASLLPDEAWNMGFTSRLIMVYAGSSPYVPLFGKQESRSALWQQLVGHLHGLTERHGEMPWEPSASAEIEAWSKAGCPPVPTHSKLVHYIPRRTLHTLKLCIISAASRGGRRIELRDLDRARGWLLGAEATMPDIFREMVAKSDAQVIEDLHFYAWGIWNKEKKPLPESRLWGFLQTRVPSEKIPRVLETAVRAKIMAVEGGGFTPQPKTSWGIEGNA